MQETVQLRPVKPADGPQISALSEKAMLGKVDLPAWEKTLWAYPLEAEFAEFPPGWVLEANNGAVVGYLGNVHQMYSLNGSLLRAGIATSWMVDPNWRGNSLQLLFAFYKQTGMHLLINGSANTATLQILTGMKMPRIPAPQYDEPCFWPVDHVSFARAALRRRAMPGASVLAYPVAALIWARHRFKAASVTSAAPAVRTASSFDSRFDEFWLKLSADGSRLRAVRTAAVLNWRYGGALANGQCVVLVAGGDSLAGYVVLQSRATDMEALRLLEICDIQVLGDDNATYLALWQAALDYARSQGVDALKWMTGTPAKRVVVDSLAPLQYRLPHWQLFYKANRNLTMDVSSPAVWDFSLFDTY